jgi:hypothetical protein
MIHSAGQFGGGLYFERSDLMRVAIIAAALALVSSPAISSPSCMTQSEARAKFPKEHLWWHGAGHCWDATPPSRARLAQRNKSREARPVQADAEREAREDNTREVKKSVSHAQQRWREAMSRMRPEDMPGATVSASAGASVDAVAVPVAPRTNFFDRWVEIAQRAPPVAPKSQLATRPADLAADARAAEPIVTPVRVMLALLVLLLALGAFELMVRRPARNP